MAVDLSLLPIEEPEPDDPPSRFFWTVMFLALLLVCVFAVLLVWPKNMPTASWKFWTSVTLFPVGFATLTVLFRYAHYAGRKEDVELRNEAARAYTQSIFDSAAVPLALIGAAYRFSSVASENGVEGIRTGSVKLDTQDPIATDGEPVKARWLTEVPDVVLRPGSKEADRDRHREVLKWMFNELLGELVGHVQSLPHGLDLRVHLVVSAEASWKEIEAFWNRAWRKRRLRQANVAELTPEQADLTWVDQWLDRVIERRGQQANLIVAVQLHPLLSTCPKAGVAEAGVALLLVPDALATKHELIRTANLHRPVTTELAEPDNAFSLALKWADVAVGSISAGWQTGFDAAQARALREPALRLGLAGRPIDLDQTVGYTGAAASWLSIACAASASASDLKDQIILRGQPNSVSCAVLRASVVQT